MLKLNTNTDAPFRLNTGSFLHHDIRVHLDQPTLRIIDKARIIGLLDKTLPRNVVQADIQHRLHHTRHRSTGTGTDRDQQRVVFVSKSSSHLFLSLLQFLCNLVFQFRWILVVMIVKICTNFCCDRESCWYRKSYINHLSQVCTFSAKEVFHLRCTICFLATKKVHVSLLFHFFCHNWYGLSCQLSVLKYEKNRGKASVKSSSLLVENLPDCTHGHVSQADISG